MSFHRTVKHQILPLVFSGFLLGSFASAGDVSIAERPFLPHFTTIQAGVDAALEGESLLVAPGPYTSFTIDAKSVQVFVTGGGEATLSGRAIVKNIGSTQFVVLSRLKLPGLVHSSLEPAIEISNVTGHVRVQDSTITGTKFVDSYYGGNFVAGTGARVSNSLNVVFSACTIEGGDSDWLAGEWAVDGGPALESLNSSIALYDCTLEGGRGSFESIPRGGNGGVGYTGLSYGLFAAGCTFKGGTGGGGDYIGYNPGGVGGDALVIDAGQAHLLEDTYVGGTGGWPDFPPPGGTIVALNGSIIDLLAGARRKISATRITGDDIVDPITITGQPGDSVFLIIARRPAFAFKKPLKGTWMVPTPFLTTTLPAGTIGAGGTLVINNIFAIPDGTVAARLFWLQAICVDTSGQPTLTGPAHVLSIE